MAAIAYFYFEDGAAFLVTRQGQRLTIDYSLDRLVPLLDPRQFFRVNRQYVVGLAAIEVVHNYSAGRLGVALKPKARQPVLVSGNRATEFKEWLGK